MYRPRYALSNTHTILWLYEYSLHKASHRVPMGDPSGIYSIFAHRAEFAGTSLPVILRFVGQIFQLMHHLSQLFSSQKEILLLTQKQKSTMKPLSDTHAAYHSHPASLWNQSYSFLYSLPGSAGVLWWYVSPLSPVFAGVQELDEADLR